MIVKNKRKGSEYYIFKNNENLGGSFMCSNKTINLKTKLKEIGKERQNRAKEGDLSEEILIIEYGQYLRYEIENYIKNKILHVNESNLGGVIENLIRKKESSKECSSDDLKKLKDIYSFCNLTTSHVDVGDESHSLNQLKNKIKDFIEISK